MFDETMKQTMKYAFAKGLFVAALATTFAACSTDDTTDQQPTAGKIKVSLQATMPETRSQITVDEENGRFSGAWDASDAMTVYANSEKAGFTFNADTKVFEGELTDQTTDWTYQAIYPRVGTDGAEHRIPFGAARTQNGSNFNGAYDPLVSEKITHANSQPGKTPAGEAVTFGLQRLTSIIALTFTTDDAAVSKEKVQSVTLTAGGGEILAAQTFDISRDGLTGALSTEGQSSSITMSYNAGSEPAAAEFKAYFNVPAGTYGALTATIVTEGHTKTVALTDGTTLAAGELAYKTTAVSSWDAPAAAPTFEWVGHTPNADGTYDKEEVKKDMSVKVNLQAAAGIKGFVITIDSQTLALVLGMVGAENIDGNIVTLDLINGTTDPAVNMVNGFILPDPDTKLEGYSELLALDLSELVPMILSLPNNVGDHIFTLTITDNQDHTLEKTLPFYVPTPITATFSNVDLWTNKATVTLSNAPESAIFQYKRSTETEWQSAEKQDNGTFEILPKYNEGTNANSYPVYDPNRNTGIYAGVTYSWQVVDGLNILATGDYTADSSTDVIENGDFENNWVDVEVGGSTVQNPQGWSSGNNDYMGMFTQHVMKNLCTASTYNGMSGKACVKLQPQVGVGQFAAGNLFTGNFVMPGSNGATSGDANFGIKYVFNARPYGLHVKYHATISTIDKPSASEEIDIARIYVLIVDWSAPHTVTSGLNKDESTFFDPAMVNTLPEGKIIAYGDLQISESTTEDSMIDAEIPLRFYDTAATPGQTISLVIACSTSYKGDYMKGSTKNLLYVDDFEWVY